MPELDILELTEALKNPEAAVAAAEEDYERKVEEIASRVVKSDSIRVVLLSGPSGSGKTTTANLLADRIRKMGERSLVVSMDNFYRDSTDPAYPRLEDGERDFESPEALDIPELLSTLSKIIGGEEFTIPRYDFKVGGRVDKTAYESFADGCVIIEGIHGLNPLFSNPFPSETVLKVFVSVSTNINRGSTRLISGKKLRFVRRMVRDYIYRGASCADTLDMWANVLEGEEKYLYPYKMTADIRFDSFHIFEPAVLKPFAEKLLTNEICTDSVYAKTVCEALEKIPELKASLVPETSLIREFIPGGIYEDLY